MSGTTSPIGLPYLVDGDPLADLPDVMQQLAEALNDYLDALSAVAPVAWTGATLGSGWANLGNVGYGTENTEYARRAGMVTLSVAATKATYSAGEVICTVPSGFRPSRPLRFVAGINGVGEFLTVHTDGTVTTDLSGTVGVVGTITYAV